MKGGLRDKERERIERKKNGGKAENERSEEGRKEGRKEGACQLIIA